MAGWGEGGGGVGWGRGGERTVGHLARQAGGDESELAHEPRHQPGKVAEGQLHLREVEPGEDVGLEELPHPKERAGEGRGRGRWGAIRGGLSSTEASSSMPALSSTEASSTTERALSSSPPRPAAATAEAEELRVRRDGAEERAFWMPTARAGFDGATMKAELCRRIGFQFATNPRDDLAD